jgi:hypothetical protein
VGTEWSNTMIVTKFAIASKTNTTIAITRMVHSNLIESVSCVRCTYCAPTYPIRSIKWLEAIGRIAPPSEAPVALMPNASVLRLSNQCEMMVGIGVKIIPHENPVRKP